MKTTQWFPVKTAPVRSGWFEGRYDSTDSDVKMYWYDAVNRLWTMECCDGSMTKAFFGNLWKTTEQWRGLTKEAS